MQILQVQFGVDILEGEKLISSGPLSIHTFICSLFFSMSCALLKLAHNSGYNMLDDMVIEGLKDSARISKGPSDCCAFFTIAPVCTDYVRSSVNWSQRNLKLLTLSAASFRVR